MWRNSLVKKSSCQRQKTGLRIQRKLEQDKYTAPRPFIVPGESPAQPWYEVGPNNNAGRSRAAIWDLSDGSNQRVFAGGVSGGLWKNERRL